MPISLGAVSNALTINSTALSCPFTHAAGRSMLAFIVARVASTGDGISSVSFNGSAMTQVIDSGPAGAATPFIRNSLWRMDDPGAASATLVVTGSATLNGAMVAVLDVDGAQTGASMIEAQNSAVANSAASISVTLTTLAPNSLILAFAGRSPGANFVSMTCSAPLLELFEDTGTNVAGYNTQIDVGSYQTTTSGVGNYKFIALGASTKLAVVAAAIATATAAQQSFTASGLAILSAYGAISPIICPVGFAPPIFRCPQST